MAHCLSKGFVLQFDTDHDLFVPVCDDWVRELYGWVAPYVSKMKEDLIDIGVWDISSFMV